MTPNKQKLESLVNSINSSLNTKDRIEIVSDEKSITIDMGFYLIKEINSPNIETETQYKRLYQNFVDTLFFEFHKAKTNGK